MSVEFRPRTAGEFFAMLKRRKWLIILPTLAMGVAVAYVVSKLPSVYESTTFLTLKPPTISEKDVQSLSDEDLSQRLQTIRKEVLSRSSLEPMIVKYKLFEQERQAGTDMALIIERMEGNIKVETDKSDAEKVGSFRISYRDRSPEAARSVAAELAGKFVNAQVSSATKVAENTREFFDKQLEDAKKNLDAYEKQRLEIMMQNVETLPESSQGLIAQLEGLRNREDTITKAKSDLGIEKGRLNDQISSNNRQMRVYDEFGEKETQDAARQASQIEDTPAYAQLMTKRAELNGQLDKLLKVFKDKHPEVVAKRDEISRINDEIQELKKNIEKRVTTASQSTSRKSELQKKNLELENQRLQSQIAQLEQQMQFKDQELAQNNAQIGILEAKINTIPNVKVSLEAVNNQYTTAKATYDDLLKKRNDANIKVEVVSSSQGETIRVIDAANLPETPVNASKRNTVMLMGLGIGLALGLFLTAVFELPRVLKIQNVEDAKHYTGLPVLASVPPLLSHHEIAWNKRSHWLKVIAGIMFAIASIPVLIMVLQKARIFEKLVS